MDNLVCESASYQEIFQYFFVCHFDSISYVSVNLKWHKRPNSAEKPRQFFSRLNKLQWKLFQKSFMNTPLNRRVGILVVWGVMKFLIAN